MPPTHSAGCAGAKAREMDTAPAGAIGGPKRSTPPMGALNHTASAERSADWAPAGKFGAAIGAAGGLGWGIEGFDALPNALNPGGELDAVHSGGSWAFLGGAAPETSAAESNGSAPEVLPVVRIWRSSILRCCSHRILRALACRA